MGTRWDPNALWRADLQNQCFIRDRAWTMFNGATDYNMKMTIVENADETATIECSVDGKLLAWYTDPCPLKGGEYGLQTSRNVAQFAINDFTDRSCDDVPVTGEDRTHVKAYLNGTLVADVVDEEHHRHKRYLSGGGPSDETNMCGDFGLATYDSDVVSYKIKDYTGYVKDTPVACIGEYGDYSECTKSCASGTKTRAFAVITPAAFGGAECAVKDGHSDTATCNADVPCPEPVDVEMTINETPESFTEDKKTALIAKIAKQLGLNVEDVEITVGAKANPVGDRRLMQASQLLITVTIKVLAAEVGAEVESSSLRNSARPLAANSNSLSPATALSSAPHANGTDTTSRSPTTSTPKRMARRASSTSATTMAVFANAFASRLRTEPYAA